MFLSDKRLWELSRPCISAFERNISSVQPMLKGVGHSLLDCFVCGLNEAGLDDLAVLGLKETDNLGYMVK